jgi:hypothetical protein
MAFTSITTANGITTLKLTALGDVSGVTLQRSGDGYVLKYSGSLANRADDVIASSTTKVQIVLGVGSLESIQKEYSLGLNVGEVRLDPTDATKTAWGSLLSEQFHYAWINGTPGNDLYSFEDTNTPSSISADTRALMVSNKRGIWVDLGNGDDKAKGSPYGDNFNISGTGLKIIDGGTNEGTTPWGNPAVDSVDVYIKLDPTKYTDTAYIDSLVNGITVSLNTNSDVAYTGYTHVLKQGTTVLAYLKNIEIVNIQIWKDFNDDGRVQWNSDPTLNESKWAKNIQLAVNVGEIRLDPTDNTKTDWGMKLSEAWHYAWINGTLSADNIVASALISDRTKALMAANKRGLWIDGGAGDDTITGTDYSDNILGGLGNDKVDGGTSIAPTSDKGQDVFEIRLTAADQASAQALLSKIKVLPSDDSNYTWMVQRLNDSNAVIETDYLINVESVSINISHPTTNQWLAGRWQSIALDVGEIRLNKTDSSLTEWGSKVADQNHFAWVNGNSSTESFDYTGLTVGAATVSAATKTLMDQYKRGVWVDMGGGNDKIVGSPYGDGFGIYASAFGIAAMGTRYIDGGTNLGKNQWGKNAIDNIDVYVVDQAQAALIKVKPLTSTTGDEGSAKTNGYTSKIVLTGPNNSETVLAYIKGIENVNIQIWNDRNGDGLRQWDQDQTKNEMTGVSNIRLVVDVNDIRVSPTDSSKTEWGTPLSDAYHMAWLNGTDANDTIVVKSLVSSNTLALQNQYKRGVFVDAGSGDDTITGSDYPDNIVGGSGTDSVDGGTQIAPTGNKGQDVFEVRLVADNTTDANALLSRVKVLPTTSNEKPGYQWKVVQRDSSNNIVQVDYLKNIEAVNINVNSPTNQWLAGRWQNIALNVGELRLDPTDSSKTQWGSKVSDQMHFAWINGTPSNESFDYTGNTILGAETVSVAGKAIMDQNKRGLWVDLGGGTDEAIGSPYGDSFNITGPGVRYIDGGLNEGNTPWGNRSIDTLDVFVSSRSDAATIKVFPIDTNAALGTEEGVAKAKGFTSKVAITNSSGEIISILAYVKNIESVNVQIWTDINGDEQRQWDSDPNKNEMSWYGNIRLAVDVNEMRRSATDPTKTEWGSKVSEQYHFAWINGTDGEDTISAKTLVSTSLLALQDQYKRGLWVDAGLGDDKVTGSDYSDNINGGAGNDEVDGGSQIAPTGERGQDVFEIRLVAADIQTAQLLISRVSVLPSDRTEFQWKVVQTDGAGNVTDTDYLKNIEAISINVNNLNNQWIAGQWKNLALNVGEIRLNPTDPTKVDNGNKLSDQMHFAWVNGVSTNEKFDYTGTLANSETVTAATKALMEKNQRGLWVDMRGGDDIAVGSPYGDNFNVVLKDSGIDYFDGGANSGSTPWGQIAQDSIDVFVESESEAKTISVVALDRTITLSVAIDTAAVDSGYTHKLMAGTRTLAYLKNIESVNIQKWIDLNNNDQRDWQTEVTYVSGFGLAPTIGYPNNGDATKNTVWINGTNGSDTINVPNLLKTLPSSTDPKLNWAGTKLEININAGQGGSDTIIGSSGPDMITVTTWNNAVNYVDGGDNIGRQTWANSTSSNAYDSLQLIFDNEGSARNAEIKTLKPGEDDTAIAKDYLYKVETKSSTTYFKNVEQVGVKVWTDLNGNGKNDYGNEVVGFSFPALQTAQVSMVSGVKGSSGTPPSNFFISGSTFTPNIDASLLINDFVANRKLYPNSSTDLPASFKLSDIANASASFGAYIMVGNGDHNLKGTDFTDYFVIGSRGNNLINGGSDIGSWPYNNNLNLSQDRVRITEEVALEAAYLDQSFIKLAKGTAKAFSIGLTPGIAADDVTGTYTIRDEDRPFIVLLPKAGKVSFDATSSQIQTIWTDLEDADTVAKFQTALDNAKAIADVKYSVFAGYVDVDGNGSREFLSFANLNAPVFSATEVSFGLATSVDNFLSPDALLGQDRFNKARHHLINLADNSDWISGSTATTADLNAITSFALSKGVAQKDYKFALVSYDDFNKLTGVQLMDDIEGIEFKLWIDVNEDYKQSGSETSTTYQNYTLESDNAIHATSDLGMTTIGGMQYAGTFGGTFLGETINLKNDMQPGIGAAEQAKKLGIRMADVSGNDTITGTDFNDFFWLCAGVDTIDGGKGNADRIAFYWKPSAAATLSTTQSGNVITIVQTVAGTATDLARITLTDTGGTIEQLNSTYALGYGSNSNFTTTNTQDTFTNIEELVIMLDSSLKNTDGTYKFTTGGVTDVNPFIIKLKTIAEYPTGTTADATKNSVTLTGTPYADIIDAAAFLQALPTSTVAKNNWGGSTLPVNINLNGGGDKLKGTSNSDMIDPGRGVNYIDGGENIGRTNWLPAWIAPELAYVGAEGTADHVRFYIKTAANASNLSIQALTASSTNEDKTAFDSGYKIKATFIDGAGGTSTNYLKNVEYVGLRLFTDTNGNNLRDLNEATSTYSYFAVNTPVVNWNFSDLNSTSSAACAFTLNVGAYVSKVEAQKDIDAFIANRKNYPVLTEDLRSLDLPANFQLSDFVNYANSYGAFMMIGFGDHFVTGTDNTDYVIVGNSGNNWIDGGLDIGYSKYETSPGVGTITASRDVYRIAHAVSSEGALTNSISKANYKVINLSTKFDLLNAKSESSNTALWTEIQNAITNLKSKYELPVNQEPEFAVIKLNPTNSTQTIGIDLLRNIERFEMRNWFDSDGNTRPSGAEVATTSQNSLVLNTDSTLYLSADQTFYTVAGLNYAGSSNGTSDSDTSTLQPILEGLLTAANPAQPSNTRGLIFSDQGGNDTVSGTNFNDYFWLSTGDDSLQGGAGTQDRVALYWAPSSTAGPATVSVDTSVAKTIKVNQLQGGTTTELVRFTLNDTNSSDKYWTATHKETNFSYSFSGVGTSFGTDTLRGIEQAVFVLPSTLLNSNGTPVITLTGLTSNLLVVDLPSS